MEPLKRKKEKVWERIKARVVKNMYFSSKKTVPNSHGKLVGTQAPGDPRMHTGAYTHDGTHAHIYTHYC